MPIIMHFATFLKLLTLNTGDKIRDLERYSKPGGFDFYRPSRDGVMQYCAHGSTKDQVLSAIEVSSAVNSLERNKEIFEKASDWLSSGPKHFSIPNRGVWRSPKKIFSVHIEPEIAYQSKETQHVVAVYPRKDIRINRDQAGAGIILLRSAYNGDSSEKFGILDAFGKKVCWTPTNISERLLETEVSAIETELARILG